MPKSVINKISAKKTSFDRAAAIFGYHKFYMCVKIMCFNWSVVCIILTLSVNVCKCVERSNSSNTLTEQTFVSTLTKAQYLECYIILRFISNSLRSSDYQNKIFKHLIYLSTVLIYKNMWSAFKIIWNNKKKKSKCLTNKIFD